MRLFRHKLTIGLLLAVLVFSFNLTANAQSIASSEVQEVAYAGEIERTFKVPSSLLTASLISDRDDLIALYSGSKYLDLYCAFKNNCCCWSTCRRSQRRRCRGKYRTCTSKIRRSKLAHGAMGAGIGAGMGAGIGAILGGPVGAAIGTALGTAGGTFIGGSIGQKDKSRECRSKRSTCRTDSNWRFNCVSNCKSARRSSSRFQSRWRYATRGRRP